MVEEKDKRVVCKDLREAHNWLKDISYYAPKEIENIGIYERGDLLGILADVRRRIEETMKHLKCPE